MDKMTDPIANIDELINQLEKFNLLPIPSTSKDSQNIKKDVTLCIRKIVLKFDTILSNKLRFDLTQKTTTTTNTTTTNTNVSNTSTTATGASSTQETNQYWNYILKHYQIPSVKFCNIYDKVQRLSEKGMLWILLSITEKSFNESINEIYKQGFDKKYYDKSSLIVSRKNDILSLCSKLHSIHLLEVKTDINEEYIKYKQTYQTKKDKEAINDELDFLSPITGKPNEKNIYVSNIPLEVIPIDKKIIPPIARNDNLNSLFFSKATMDLMQPINGDNNYNNTQGGGIGQGMDSLFFAIENEDYDLMDGQIEGMRSYRNSTKNNKQITHSNNNPKINDDKRMYFFNNLGSHSGTFNNTYNNDKDNNIHHKEKENNIIITKTADFRSVFKDNFYSFKEKVKQAQSFTLGKKKPDNHTNPHPHLHQQGEDSFNSNTTTTTTNQSNKTKNDLILNPKRKLFFPFDKSFKAARRADKTIYTKKDVILFKNKEITLTNSVLFYLNFFYKKEPYFRYKTKINSSKPITIESQNYQCALCNKKFSTIMNIPTETIYWCSYYLRFICRECISEEYSIIPDFILKFWVYKKFTISTSAKCLLEKWYKKPVIHFKQNDSIIKRSDQLHYALILKRKIHKIYDLMKCDKMNEIIEKLLGEHKYLVLRENLLSLQDMVEINDKSFFHKLKGYLIEMQKHILIDCDVCLYKGGKCIMCMSKEIIYAFDVENIIYCNDCKKMFHKKCCTVHPCIINR